MKSIFNKDMLSKLVFAAIIATGPAMLWIHAHAEEKHNETKTALEIHKTEGKIEDTHREITQIELSPNRSEPYIMERKRKMLEKLEKLGDRLKGLKS